MPLLSVLTVDDPRIAVYRDLPLRKRQPSNRLFVAEGRLLVKRLIASSFKLHSVLIEENRCQEIAASVPAGVPVYTATRELLEAIAGFKFHAGVIACGYRNHSSWPWQISTDAPGPHVVTVCDDVFDVENLGSILRTSLALGSAGAICGPRSADPFNRRALRLSMGAAFKLPIYHTDSTPQTLSHLRSLQYDIVAAVAGDDAETLSSAPRAARTAIVLGNEANGLPAETLACCNRRITIPMHQRADSLNVSVAAGIILHHFLSATAPGI